MNTKVSLQSFLKHYLKHLNNDDTVNIKKLCAYAKENERAEYPTVLYCFTQNKTNLLKKYGTQHMLELLVELENTSLNEQSLLQLYVNTSNKLNAEFYRTYRTFLSKSESHENSLKQRALCFQIVEQYINSGKITKYKLCKQTNTNMSNFNKALKNKDYSKVSYEKCMAMVNLVSSL